nr:hypothetical protein [Clostridia bacterium]
MKIKKIMAGLTALLMLIPVITACSGGGDTKADDTTAADTADTAVSTEAETTGKLLPDLPEKDFGGAEFHFLTSGPTDTNGEPWASYDFYVEAENGDVINDAVFARNMHVNETYNVKITETQCATSTLADAQKVILAGEDVYDTVVTNFQSASKLWQAGQVVDMFDIPYLDLAQPWWDVNLVESMSIGGTLGFATGDITLMDNDAYWVLMFNKIMHEDYNLDSIYEMVENDSWYMDSMAELMSKVTQDLDGDGAMTWQNDRYGFTTGGTTALTSLYQSGLTLTSKDSDDLPYFDLNTDRAVIAAEKMGKMLASKDTLIWNAVDIRPADSQQAFMEGRVLFYGEVLMYITLMHSSETDFGVVPWPKLDEKQEEYGHVGVASALKCVTVPMTQSDLEFTGIVLEAMAAESMYTLTPAYYEISLNTKYMRDNESVQMLDIILSTMSADLAYVFDWGGLSSALQTSIKNNDGQFMSALDSNLEKFNSEMNATVEDFTSR